MTKKEKQILENDMVEFHFNKAMKEFHTESFHVAFSLGKCRATVYTLDNYWLLKSYNTFVACIDKDTLVCYDNLRKQYGYTATSSQHIAKFAKKYYGLVRKTYR